jgi:hypothetical protein
MNSFHPFAGLFLTSSTRSIIATFLDSRHRMWI